MERALRAAEAAITFFYYDGIRTVISFYEDTLGFALVLNQGMARIYRVAPNCLFGIVDGHRGHLRHQPRSSVLFTIVAEDVAGWHARLAARGAQNLSPIQRGPHHDHFFFEDPAGYALEVQRFHDPAVMALLRP